MFDLIIIGGGPGGYTAAEEAQRQGLSAAIVEKDRLGGTCLQRGCVPTKAYLHAAETVEKARAYSRDVAPDLRAMYDKKCALVDELTDGVIALMARCKAAVYHGTGTLTNAQPPFAVRVLDADGAETVVEGAQVLIATGSRPARLPVEGCELPAVWTSDDILGEKAAEPFESLLIIGGGVIGVELASVYARLGVNVTVLEAEKNCLPMMDRELGRSAEAILKALGVSVLTGCKLQSVTPDDEDFIAVYEKGGAFESVSASRVLLATGRVPETAGLLGEGVELAMSRRAIAVDERYQTSLPGVYAIGDVNGLCPLAHAASAQARAAIAALCGQPSPVNDRLIPSCVYTAPEIASVGLTQDEAKALGQDVIVGKAVLAHNARTLIEGLGRGFVKLVFDKASGRIVGGQLCCGRATDLIAQITQAIARGDTPEDIVRAVQAHPTFSEALGEAVLAALEKK
ncbi:MAG: dihydrolipoyl dehydrogenase [Eubacteriales bacterium]|nr:dihydrolipoyl dehydrogenase [Eubacteriales bacterium]